MVGALAGFRALVDRGDEAFARHAAACMYEYLTDLEAARHKLDGGFPEGLLEEDGTETG